jgi:hypothetical protein
MDNMKKERRMVIIIMAMAKERKKKLGNPSWEIRLRGCVCGLPNRILQYTMPAAPRLATLRLQHRSFTAARPPQAL